MGILKVLKTTLRRNHQSELKPGAFAPGAGAPTLLRGEVAAGAGASRNSFPKIQSAKVASAAPGLHPVYAPALSNRPLYQSWGAEPESTRAVICAGVLYFGNGCGHDDEEIHCLGKAQIRLGTLIQAGGFV